MLMFRINFGFDRICYCWFEKMPIRVFEIPIIQKGEKPSYSKYRQSKKDHIESSVYSASMASSIVAGTMEVVKVTGIGRWGIVSSTSSPNSHRSVAFLSETLFYRNLLFVSSSLLRPYRVRFSCRSSVDPTVVVVTEQLTSTTPSVALYQVSSTVVMGNNWMRDVTAAPFSTVFITWFVLARHCIEQPLCTIWSTFNSFRLATGHLFHHRSVRGPNAAASPRL